MTTSLDHVNDDFSVKLVVYCYLHNLIDIRYVIPESAFTGTMH